MFNFNGELAASKSWMNRALILQSWNSSLTIKGSSPADDVVYLQKALQAWKHGETTFEAGHGGTTFRFLAVRLSREKGHFFIKASPTLLQRPQKDLLSFFEYVGVKAFITNNGLDIQTEGWKNSGFTIPVNTENSSQFISAVLLSCFNLQYPLVLQIGEKVTSESYLQMTLALLKQAGADIVVNKDTIIIAAGLQILPTKLSTELDVSSAFSLICAAVLDGEVTITNWTSQSSQPDQIFLKIFDHMKIVYQLNDKQFTIKRQNEFNGTEYYLGPSPDLFPVLCALACFAKTPSRFFGAPQLKHKESDRLQKTSELLHLCRVKHELLSDGIVIYPAVTIPTTPFSFNPAQDHRMAMAAALFKLKKFPIQILHPEVVNKSYPDFFQNIGMKDIVL